MNTKKEKTKKKKPMGARLSQDPALSLTAHICAHRPIFLTGYKGLAHLKTL